MCACHSLHTRSHPLVSVLSLVELTYILKTHDDCVKMHILCSFIFNSIVFKSVKNILPRIYIHGK